MWKIKQEVYRLKKTRKRRDFINFVWYLKLFLKYNQNSKRVAQIMI